MRLIGTLTVWKCILPAFGQALLPLPLCLPPLAGRIVLAWIKFGLKVTMLATALCLDLCRLSARGRKADTGALWK